MPQTIEAISHAKAAGVSLVSPSTRSTSGSDPERVQAGARRPERRSGEYGGESPFISVSAKTGKGIDELSKHPPSGRGEGAEGPCDAPAKASSSSRGSTRARPVATCWCSRGRSSAATSCSRAPRSPCARDARREREADSDGSPSIRSRSRVLPTCRTPSTQIVVLGDERKAREIALFRQASSATSSSRSSRRRSRRTSSTRWRGEAKVLNILLKADVQARRKRCPRAHEAVHER